MCITRLHARVPSCKLDSVATLQGYDLRFHKKSSDGSGKCNAFHTGNTKDVVLGVIFDIDAKDKKKLDDAEGLGKGYHEEPILHVVTIPGIEVVPVLIYVADSNYINNSLVPFTWYMDFVAEGAKQHCFPAWYMSKLQAVALTAVPDTDSAMDAANRSLLPC